MSTCIFTMKEINQNIIDLEIFLSKLVKQNVPFRQLIVASSMACVFTDLFGQEL